MTLRPTFYHPAKVTQVDNTGGSAHFTFAQVSANNPPNSVGPIVQFSVSCETLDIKKFLGSKQRYIRAGS